MIRTIAQRTVLFAAMFAALLLTTCITPLPASDTAADAELREQSPAWYILGQPDGGDLLHGLPQRLGLAAASDRVNAPTDEADVAASVVVEYDGALEGDLFLGLFASARFAAAPPLEVYQFSGPGEHEIRLPEGEWSIAAMIGLPPHPEALGVDQNWPQQIHVTSGQSPEIHVLVSPKFRARPAGVPRLEEGFASLWNPVDPVRLAIVRMYDSSGAPYPFNRVTFVDRDDQTTQPTSFHEIGTDHFGFAYCDEIDGPFSLMVQRFEFDPDECLFRWHHKKLSRLYDAMDRPIIDFHWEEFPAGTGRVAGQVHDQYGQPLTEYFLTLTQQIGERMDWSDAETFVFKQAVMDDNGRFEISALPPGEYTAMIRHFDYETHAWSFDGPQVFVPDTENASLEVDWEVEAKDRFYGRVQYDDGRPLTQGYWVARYVRRPQFASGSSQLLHDDGTLRVCLSKVEQDNLAIYAESRIDVYDSEGSLLLQIPIEELSRDAANPTVFTMPRE